MDRKGREKGFYNRSLERALKILCAFSSERQGMTLGQLSEAVGLPKATTMRLSMTLIDHDFLRYDSQTKKYSLGLKLFELGSIVFSTFSLRKIVSPYLASLQAKIAKTTFLGVILDDQLVYLDKHEDPRNPIRFASNIGMRRPPYFGMLGQLLMAYMEEEEVDRILKKTPLAPLTKLSIVDVGEFKKRLISIREKGYFIDEGEAIDGISGISAPIFDYTGKVVGGIGIGFISISVDEDEKKALVKEVVQTAKKISQELGYGGY
ncbi:MAG: IclR family transcriptional regulator [Syntrophorhabdaceae bacterium]|nr:IclR family transcriptional regulator [Syntrophorhabdaceae bacterium]